MSTTLIIFSQYSSCLPIMLIFGVATTVTVIHKTIPHQVSSFLAIEKFSGGKATELLTKLVENVIIDDSIHFKLGGKVLGRLLEIFAFNDFSVKRFLSGYRVKFLNIFPVGLCVLSLI